MRNIQVVEFLISRRVSSFDYVEDEENLSEMLLFSIE